MRFVLTGISGTGKTALLEGLRERLPADAFRLCDIDEEGVPSNAGDAWRRRRVAQWCALSSEAAGGGERSVLAGPVLPDDVPPDDRGPALRFCLLEACPASIAERLRSRYADPNAAAELRRVSGLSVDGFVEAMIDARRGFRERFERSALDWFALDTSARSFPDSLDEVVAWIRGAA